MMLSACGCSKPASTAAVDGATDVAAPVCGADVTLIFCMPSASESVPMPALFMREGCNQGVRVDMTDGNTACVRFDTSVWMTSGASTGSSTGTTTIVGNFREHCFTQLASDQVIEIGLNATSMFSDASGTISVLFTGGTSASACGGLDTSSGGH